MNVKMVTCPMMMINPPSASASLPTANVMVNVDTSPMDVVPRVIPTGRELPLALLVGLFAVLLEEAVAKVTTVLIPKMIWSHVAVVWPRILSAFL